MSKVLYTSAAVRNAIVDLLARPSARRVVVVAFVGDRAEAYLPHPKGIDLVCCPSPSGTNPNTLRLLRSRGVRVFFSDKLHAKVYWSQGRGAVISSANLSTNALGAGGQLEVGILLPPREFDMARFRRRIGMYFPTDADFLRHERSYNLHFINNPRNGGPPGPEYTFDKWYGSPTRTPWKLGWWSECVYPLSERARNWVHSTYPGRDDVANLQACQPGEYRKGDWVLSFLLNKRLGSVEWLFVDHVARIGKHEKGIYHKDYPCQAVQVWPNSRYPKPPFKLDKEFRQAFAHALRGCAERVKALEGSKPPEWLLKKIRAEYS